MITWRDNCCFCCCYRCLLVCVLRGYQIYLRKFTAAAPVVVAVFFVDTHELYLVNYIVIVMICLDIAAARGIGNKLRTAIPFA